jgi:hypothetical protein
MAQSVSGSWAALYDALTGVFAGQDGTLVSPGDPGNYEPDLIIAVMGIDLAPITMPTMGTNRSRDKRYTQHVLVSAYVAGGPEAQAPAVANAVAAAELIEAYFRVSPNEKLGGACYNAFVSAMPLEVDIAWEAIDGVANLVPAGRTATVDVNVEIWVRLS